VQPTFCGEKWRFGAGGDGDAKEDLEFADTSYTTEAIGLHTDGTYFSQPPGIQVSIIDDDDNDGHSN